MKETPLAISVESRPDAVVVHVRGDVTWQGSARMDEAIAAHLEGPGVPVVVNLSRTTYMNSTALAVLVKLHAQAKGIGRPLRLEAPSPNLLRMLELAKLLDGQ